MQPPRTVGRRVEWANPSRMEREYMKSKYTETLNMYGLDILTRGKYIYPVWKGVPVKPSKSADEEMARLRIYLDEVCRVLDEGYDCSRSRRRNGTIERCMRMKGRIIRVVVAKSHSTWDGEPVWVITHIGEIHGK